LIHFFYRYWSNSLHYYPTSELIKKVNNHLCNSVFSQFVFLVDQLFEINLSYLDKKVIFENNNYISISSGCSGLKQQLQFIVLFLFLRGSLLKKLWFIPLGMVLIHISNLLRLTLLSFVLIYCPGKWNLFHDDIFRFFSYSLIFIMWVWWVEKLRN